MAVSNITVHPSVLLMLAITAGCASISTLKNAESIPESQCEITVFSSFESAKAKGEIEELCIISGTSSGSFSHTVATAIEKHKRKACSCGADKVYVQAQDAGTLGTASVTLVAFRYLENISDSQKDSKFPVTDELLKKAKRCQSKGGIWVNDNCVISVE